MCLLDPDENGEFITSMPIEDEDQTILKRHNLCSRIRAMVSLPLLGRARDHSR